MQPLVFNAAPSVKLTDASGHEVNDSNGESIVPEAGGLNGDKEKGTQHTGEFQTEYNNWEWEQATTENQQQHRYTQSGTHKSLSLPRPHPIPPPPPSQAPSHSFGLTQVSVAAKTAELVVEGQRSVIDNTARERA